VYKHNKPEVHETVRQNRNSNTTGSIQEINGARKTVKIRQVQKQSDLK
jgi:hypothetical protein